MHLDRELIKKLRKQLGKQQQQALNFKFLNDRIFAKSINNKGASIYKIIKTNSAYAFLAWAAVIKTQKQKPRQFKK